MTVPIGLILDILVIVLLLAVIFYAITLNKRLRSLRETRAELREATRTFAEAAIKADSGIKGLKRTADETSDTLDKKLKSAQRAKDELGFLVDAAEAVAARLEGKPGIPARPPAEAAGSAPAAPSQRPAPRASRDPAPRSKAAPADPVGDPGDLLKETPVRGGTSTDTGADTKSSDRPARERDILKTLENLR